MILANTIFAATPTTPKSLDLGIPKECTKILKEQATKDGMSVAREYACGTQIYQDSIDFRALKNTRNVFDVDMATGKRTLAGTTKLTIKKPQEKNFQVLNAEDTKIAIENDRVRKEQTAAKQRVAQVAKKRATKKAAELAKQQARPADEKGMLASADQKADDSNKKATDIVADTQPTTKDIQSETTITLLRAELEEARIQIIQQQKSISSLTASIAGLEKKLGENNWMLGFQKSLQEKHWTLKYWFPTALLVTLVLLIVIVTFIHKMWSHLSTISTRFEKTNKELLREQYNHKGTLITLQATQAELKVARDLYSQTIFSDRDIDEAVTKALAEPDMDGPISAEKAQKDYFIWKHPVSKNEFRFETLLQDQDGKIHGHCPVEGCSHPEFEGVKIKTVTAHLMQKHTESELPCCLPKLSVYITEQEAVA